MKWILLESSTMTNESGYGSTKGEMELKHNGSVLNEFGTVMINWAWTLKIRVDKSRDDYGGEVQVHSLLKGVVLTSLRVRNSDRLLSLLQQLGIELDLVADHLPRELLGIDV